jgi:hypothetical protein
LALLFARAKKKAAKKTFSINITQQKYTPLRGYNMVFQKKKKKNERKG